MSGSHRSTAQPLILMVPKKHDQILHFQHYILVRDQKGAPKPVDDRAEPSQAGSVSSARYCLARFGIFVEYRAEPYSNHFQIIVDTSLTKL